MMISNLTVYSPDVFLLTGIPGLENVQSWLAIPLCTLYVAAVLGNCTILFIVHTEPSLHQPMYYFLSMLALSDLGLSVSTMPTMLSLFLLNSREVNVNSCIAQLYFVHTFSLMESAMLLAMAFDRFVAIQQPLRYTSILTDSTVLRTGLAFAVRSAFMVMPTPILLRRLQFCLPNILSHSFCLHQDVMKLSCSDRRINSILGLFVVVSTMGLDSVLIVLSYILIVSTVLGIASRDERLKVLNTCVSHICAVLIFYIPMIGISMIHRFGKHASPLVHVLMADVYVLVPPVMNPIVYSVKTKQIRRQILGDLVNIAHAGCALTHTSELSEDVIAPSSPSRSVSAPSFTLLCEIPPLGSPHPDTPPVLSVVSWYFPSSDTGPIVLILQVVKTDLYCRRSRFPTKLPKAINVRRTDIPTRQAGGQSACLESQ
ncbi:olfactory receptor 51A7-like [Rhea pennata]|uniref:olfactory receptor 51A7-like n=1 Tax=Rhea pennata TaxID=8795 RepID=UPI002E2563B4